MTEKRSRDIYLNYSGSLRLIIVTFLLWGFVTVINGFLLDELVLGLNLTSVEADLLTYIFFGVYMLIGYPASLIIEKIGFKEAIKVGLYISAAAVFPMVLGARELSYELIVLGTFLLASGIAIIQVSANMYIVLVGDYEGGPSRLLFGQALNSFGTWMAPLIGTLIRDAQPHHLDDLEQIAIFKSELVVLPYVLFTVIFIGMAIFINFSDLPQLNKFNEVPTNIKDDTRTSVFQYKHVVLGALAICFYVGAEVSIGNKLDEYILEELQLTNFKSFIGYIIPYYWGGAMVGRFVGSYVSRRVSANKMLAACSVFAIAFLVFSMVSKSVPSMMFILGIGFFNSIMFPIIFYLGTHGMGRLSARASGLLIAGIVGGAAILWIFNQIPDLKVALWIPIGCYAFIFLYGIWGYKYKEKEHLMI